MEGRSTNRSTIGRGKCYIAAEMSANHGQNFEEAVKIIEAAANAGADAVKLQTYTPDTLTIDCDRAPFRIKGTPWDGQTLYQLYERAFTPWAWQPKLKRVAERLGMDLFSTPFDPTAIHFLEEMDVRAYKISSFEIVDMPLIRTVARTGKPMILSTGMATIAEIEEAVREAREAGAEEIILLKCTSAYPSPPSEMNLRTIPHMREHFGVPVGLSDHTLGIAAPVAAVALGARMLEKHLTLSRKVEGPDSGFSLEPSEFKAMVEAVRTTEEALGSVEYKPTPHEQSSRIFRRSLFAVADIHKNQEFTTDNVRSIRPGFGLHPRHLDDVLRCRARVPIRRGTPLSWDLIRGDDQKRQFAETLVGPGDMHPV